MTTQSLHSSWRVILGVLCEELDGVWLREGGGVAMASICAHDVQGSWIRPLPVD
jgi:hypothetical protein